MDYLLSIHNYNYETWGSKFPDNKVNIFDLPLSNNWRSFIFKDICNKMNCDKINEDISNLLKKTNGKINIFPYPDLLFNSFNHVNYNNLKVVILGQDPYFNSKIINNKEIPEAMGLSFSVPIGIPIPSSLNNIYKNALEYGHFNRYPDHGNLEFWAYQGCLLLNTYLTVQKGHKNSHSCIWTKFTDLIIENISDKFNGIIFVLWGGPALKKLNLIDTQKHKVLISSHPSGLSNTKSLGKYPAFSSIDQFGTINKMLNELGKKEIIWQI